MNTEEKFVHPDIQSLKTETSPNTLRARILTKLQSKEEKNSMRIRNNMLRLSVSALAIGAIATGTLLMSNTASASGISKVHAAFQDASRYHVKSYIVENGKRNLMTETWVDGTKQQVTIYGPDGQAMNLDFGWLEELTGDLTSKIHLLTPEQIANDKTMGKILKESMTKFNLPANGSFGDAKIFITGPDGKMSEEELKKLPAELQKMMKDIKAQVKVLDGNGALKPEELKKLLDGAIDVKILDGNGELPVELKNLLKDGKSDVKFFDGFMAAPIMMGGENGVQYLRKLMEDKELWNIESGVQLNGRTVDRYRLKDGLVNLELFVSPITGLPVMTRTKLGFGKEDVVLEDEYDYVTPMPVASKKPTPKDVKAKE